MTPARLKGIEHTWRLSTDETGAARRVTPPALVALEQVRELIAEVRRLQTACTAAQALLRSYNEEEALKILDAACEPRVDRTVAKKIRLEDDDQDLTGGKR